jgi:hypothetical protein
MTMENAIMVALVEFDKWLDANLDRVKDMTSEERMDLFFDEVVTMPIKD